MNCINYFYSIIAPRSRVCGREIIFFITLRDLHTPSLPFPLASSSSSREGFAFSCRKLCMKMKRVKRVNARREKKVKEGT
jgi:hypothetical protein